VNKVDEVEAFRSGKFATQQKIFPYKMDEIQVGTEIYRNVDAEFEKQLKNSKTCRKIKASIEFDLGKIKVIDEDKNSAEILYKFEELAQNEEKMGANIINQLKKSGDTDFLIEEVNVLTQKIPFLPVSKLNELRRDLLEKLMDGRIKGLQSRLCFPTQQHNSDANFPQTEMDYKANVLNKFAKEFYESHGCNITEMALEHCKTSGAGKVAMTTKHCLKYAFNMCKLNSAKQVLQAPKKLYLIDEKGKRYELKFNCQNCEMEIIF